MDIRPKCCLCLSYMYAIELERSRTVQCCRHTNRLYCYRCLSNYKDRVMTDRLPETSIYDCDGCGLQHNAAYLFDILRGLEYTSLNRLHRLGQLGVALSQSRDFKEEARLMMEVANEHLEKNYLHKTGINDSRDHGFSIAAWKAEATHKEQKQKFMEEE